MKLNKKKNEIMNFNWYHERVSITIRLVIGGLIVLLAQPLYANNQTDEDSILTMLHQEVDSHYNQFRSGNLPVNFVGVNVCDVQTINIESSLGATMQKDHDSFPQYSVNVKIGTPQSKYFKPLASGFLRPNNSFASDENFYGDIDQLRVAVSDQLQAAYAGMSKTPKLFSNDRDVISNLEDVRFYSTPTPGRYYEKALSQSDVNMDEWENMLNEVCAVFRSSDYQINVTIKLKCKMERRYFVSSDGGEIVKNNPSYVLSIASQIVTSWGEKLPLEKDFFATSLEDLPSKTELKETAENLLTRLQKMYSAPRMDSYEGPVLFGSIASGVIIHEIIGHKLEASESGDTATMSQKMNKQIFPDFVQIYDDPTVTEYTGVPLVGHYQYDDEGVPSQKVECVKDGILRSLLTSRRAFFEGSVSNGHGRGTILNEAAARQANLFVKSSAPVTDKRLREMLLNEIREQNKEFGYYIPSISSGGEVKDHPLQLLDTPDSKSKFMITVEYAFKVYADGRPDELVSGGMLISSPEAIWNAITAMGTECEVNNGSCGAKSGIIPVSLIAPKMLVKNMKWHISSDSQAKSKILPTMPAIPNLQFESEPKTIIKALEDEMLVVKNNVKSEEAPLCFADFIVDSETHEGFNYSNGVCLDSVVKKSTIGNVRLYSGEKQNVSEIQVSPFNTGFSLPIKCDYYVLRHIMRDKVLTAYEKMLSSHSKKNEKSVDSPRLKEFSPIECISGRQLHILNKEELRDISYILSIEMAKYDEFKNPSVRVSQKMYDDYRVTSEGQKILKRQAYLSIYGHADMKTVDGRYEHRVIKVELLDTDASLAKREFCKKLKETIESYKDIAQTLTVDAPITYDGLVLLEGEPVKGLLFRNLNQCLADKISRNGLKTNIGDSVLDKRLCVTQLSGVPSYNGRKLWGFEEFDMDGQKPKAMILVDHGILKNKLSGRLTYGDNSHSTGNERISRGVTTVFPGVLRVTSSEVDKQKSIRSRFVEMAKKAGQKYAYIIRKFDSDTEETLIRVNTTTLEEQRLKCNYQYRSNNANLIAVSKEEYLTQERNFTPCSFIYPTALLLDNIQLRITKK